MNESHTQKQAYFRDIQLKDVIEITSFVNASKIDVGKNYVFEGEMHNLWEMQYISRGSAYVAVKDGFYELKAGEISFYRPNQFHVVYGNGHTSAQMWVFSFQCKSPVIKYLENCAISASEESERLMERILNEVGKSFEVNASGSDSGVILKKKKRTQFGYSQIIKNRIEELLILLMREKNRPIPICRTGTSSVNAAEIRAMLTQNIYSKLTVAQIAEKFSISPTYLKQIYRAGYSSGIIADFNLMKSKRAAELLESTDLSVTEISEIMGFDNVYFFSNFFKRYMGESPGLYRKRKRNTKA